MIFAIGGSFLPLKGFFGHLMIEQELIASLQAISLAA